MGNIELNIKSIVSREVIFCVFFSIQITRGGGKSWLAERRNFEVS